MTYHGLKNGYYDNNVVTKRRTNRAPKMRQGDLWNEVHLIRANAVDVSDLFPLPQMKK